MESTAFEKEDGGIEEADGGFELVQITIRSWTSIVRRGLQLVRKRRLWGLLGGYLNMLKRRGLEG